MKPDEFLDFMLKEWQLLPYREKEKYIEFYRKSPKFQEKMVKIIEQEEKARPVK